MRPEFILPIWNEWHEKHSEPHRHHHKAEHIFAMFRYADEMGMDLDPVEIMAIWLHDFFYDIGANDNEERSAEFAEKYVTDNKKHFINWGAHLNPRIVRDAILGTKDGVSRHTYDYIRLGDNIIDLDYCILSSLPGRYNEYVSAVAKEWIPHCGFMQFLQGRAEWIDDMTARHSIFVGKHATLYMERRARENLMDEYDRMNNPKLYAQVYKIDAGEIE